MFSGWTMSSFLLGRGAGGMAGVLTRRWRERPAGLLLCQRRFWNARQAVRVRVLLLSNILVSSRCKGGYARCRDMSSDVVAAMSRT